VRECLARRRALDTLHSAPLRSANTSRRASLKGEGEMEVKGSAARDGVADKASSRRATSVQRRGFQEKKQAASSRCAAVSEYEVSLSAQRIERDNQASTRLVLGWCSRSVRRTEPGGHVRGGVMASNARSCHLAEKKHRASRYSWSLFDSWSLSDNNVFRSCADRESALAAVTPPRRGRLADVDASRAAVAHPRQAGSAPAT
jgi:hypothetical protein